MGPGPIYGRASHPRGRWAQSKPGRMFEATFKPGRMFEAIVNRHTKPDPGQPQPGLAA